MSAQVFQVGDIGIVVSARGPLAVGSAVRIARVEFGSDGTRVYGVERPDGLGLHWFIEGEIDRQPAEAP